MLKKGNTYQVKFPINDGHAGDKTVTRFKISFKAKKSENKWINIQVTDFENHILNDNDTVRLLDYDLFTGEEYNGNLYFYISARIEKVIE